MSGDKVGRKGIDGGDQGERAAAVGGWGGRTCVPIWEGLGHSQGMPRRTFLSPIGAVLGARPLGAN